MTSTISKTERNAQRLSIPLTIRVEANETPFKIWREITHLKSISEIGASFYLNRFFDVGQLIFLNIPLEEQLRRYDLDEQQYCIWSIVRHCNQTTVGKSSVYHIGVAFIGKEPPFSYQKHPATIYKLGELKADGLWEISDDDKSSSTRKQSRYSIPVEVFISLCDSEGNISQSEKTVAENISACGAAVFSSLGLKIGDKVKFIKEQGGFSAMAIVRNRRIGDDHLPRIHLEFIAARFPLEGIG